FDSHTLPPAFAMTRKAALLATRVARRVGAGITLLGFVAAFGAAGAQRPDSTRVRSAPRAVTTADSMKPPLSPRRAFLYSALIPGSAQSVLGRHKAATVMLVIEAMSIAMIRESAADVREAHVVTNSSPVGVFDSGIGGLTVAHEVMRQLPHESVTYFGDTARVPYGPKSPETVRRYSREIASFLADQGVKALVVACNTATAHALPTLRESLTMPVIGVIEPGARAAVRATRNGHVGLI